MIVESFCEKDTFTTAVELGKNAKPGDIFLLEGDLGTGKTVFAKGFATGLGVEEPITSPTFTIVQEYESGRIPLYHFDVYRIADPEEMYELGYENYFWGEGVCLIEWARLISELLPSECREIRIEKDLEKGFDYRRITIQDVTDVVR
ncbi:MAG: tRNA (adenosine(37)-N6)-threonylcarbamoyltransferase complex ATPase subunit type 1 TsaE [Eubacterium sp.]|nr:tRNA (adenosine(37)-N6)-threonylcarbamoyltransferase complex ATPase subunit type 1 TsaE [Eubacterium sp.]